MKIEVFGKKFNEDETAIRINKKGIDEIPDLSGFKKLKILDLSNNNISKIEGLEKLVNLEELDFSGNNISKIENIEALTNLKTLTLFGNNIRVIENLEKLTKLEALNLYGNNIRIIENLETLLNLEILRLSFNKIKVIPQLQGLKNLKELFLEDNQIKKIQGIDKCEKLQKIYLDKNHISELDFDKIPKNTSILQLWQNNIKKIIKPQKQHLVLNILDLLENPIKCIKYIEYLPNIKDLAIDGKTVKEISKNTYDFVKMKQETEASTSFILHTANTTGARKLDAFVKQKNIAIID